MLSEEMINHEFTRAFKGYDIEQVEEYIEKLIFMYEQLANENKEISARFEQLTASVEENRQTVENAQSLNDDRDKIIAEAEKQARLIHEEANTKAKSSVSSAENMARRLLSEAKARADSIKAEGAQMKAEAEAEAQRIIDNAMLEAKKLIRATKVNCQKRTDEANERLSEIQAEHDRVAKLAADFKTVLFEAYSAQLLSIENIEIPEYQLPQNEETEENGTFAEEADEKTEASEDIQNVEDIDTRAEISDVKVSEDEASENEAAEDEQESVAAEEIIKITYDEIEDDILPDIKDGDGLSEAEQELPSVEERSFDFNGILLDINADPIPKAKPKKNDSKYKPSIYAGIEVQKEHSGQIKYDSGDISSMNRTLDEIMAKRGKDPAEAKRIGNSKLGFLK